MENIHLKEPDLNLSRVALGTWAIGGWMWGGTDEQAAVDAIRAAVDRGVDVAIWGARRPDQLEPIEQVFDWRLDPEDIDTVEKIVVDTVADPVGPEFMAPPDRNGNTTP